MLRRLGTLSLAIVLTALPSLARICLTGCDVEKFATTHEHRLRRQMAPGSERSGDKNCPLHDSQPSPEQPAKPDVPRGPSPCQHQQEVASADYAKSRSLVLVTDYSFTIFTASIVTSLIRGAVDGPGANQQPISAPRSSSILVLRI